jgi:PAS domain-containing protein
MRAESGLLYFEASADGQIEKIMGDTTWLPFPVKAHESKVFDVLPALTGAHLMSSLELDFVELLPEVYVDIQFQCHDGRQYVWLRNTSRHAAHLRAAQQVANSKALKEAIASRWLDDVRRESSHLRAVLNTVPLPVAYWSRSGELLFANDHFRAIAPPSSLDAKPRATDATLGAVAVPESAWQDAQRLSGLGAVLFSRTALPDAPKCKLVADVSPAGELTGLLDISYRLNTH